MVSLGLRGQVRSFLLKVILIISSKSTNCIEYLRHPSTTIICCLYKSFSSVSTSLNTGNNNDRSEKEAGTGPFRDAEASGTRGKIGTNSVCGITGTGESERRNALGWKLSVNAWEDINLGTAYKASSSLTGAISLITSVVTGLKSFNKSCRERGRDRLSSEPN